VWKDLTDGGRTNDHFILPIERTGFMSVLTNAKGWLQEIIEVGLLLLGLAVVVNILFADAPFVGDVAANLTSLISTLGQQGLVGLIVVGLILVLLGKRRAG